MPAFYGDWFMGRVKEGFAGVVNPFGGGRYIVSLRGEDVACCVFWSKDFGPFLENLKILDSLGYRFYFNYTVTGLPGVFESNLEKQSAIETLKRLSQVYSPRHINWRFDPIIISSICGRDYYIRAFEELAGLRDQIKAPEGIGFCLDTSHIFAAGYDLRTEKACRKTVAAFEKIVGLAHVYVIHLNDSKKDLGSRVDRHEHIGEGAIGLEAFKFFMNDHNN